ncbi:uncharacterized protein J7T54_001002 [Emericellopsis cladophorae]|uniref:Uncharacterized protein n=1 Tax=Emericellopsis cladophorae TaxID=2686198 RepID=A0A9Q0BBF8_9HYPO|nr:uncharacterized protein J7T54_001002 [Emericellopsis cladophorae]KAI6779272.1 hypothetical protein J7T54_001002 [Emericellopsis cladophorae]
MSTSSEPNQNIRGYEPGEIAAKGCVTVDIVIADLGVTLQALIDSQYVDSKTMSHRPGIILKYLPYLYDGITGKLLTGGLYLFDTYEDAKDYIRWASEEFEVGEPKVKFTEQPMFKSFTDQVWKTWSCSEPDAEPKLQSLYAKVKNAAETGNAASVWLLYDPSTRKVGLQLAFRKQGVAEPSAAARDLRDAGWTALGDVLSQQLHLKPLFDRTGVLLTLWLPRSRAAGGSELAIPYYPVVPDISHNYFRGSTH